MGLWVPSTYRLGSIDQTGAPPLTAKGGVTITASGTAHTMGAWAALLDPVAFDAYGLFLLLTGVSTAATNTSFLVNIGVGPSGGGSEQIAIPFLDAGEAASANTPFGKAYFFPLFIKSGLRVSAQGQAVIASDTCVIRAHVLEYPLGPFAAGKWAQFGADSANSRGTSVPSGNAAFGAWTQITGSTLGRPYSLFHVGFDTLGDTSVTAAENRINIGYGPTSTQVVQIGTWDFMVLSGSEDIGGPFQQLPVSCAVPSGTHLWARLNGNSTENRGVIIYAA